MGEPIRTCVASSVFAAAVLVGCSAFGAEPATDAITEAATDAVTEAGDIGGGPRVVVDRVIDGDSMELSIDGAAVEVRLLGVNAPELRTPAGAMSCNGAAAREFVGELVASGDDVRFVAGERDRFGRTLGELVIDGRPVTASLVEAGWALALWSADDPDRTAAMEAAAARRDGLWGDTCGAPAATGLRISEMKVDAAGDDRDNPADEWVTVTNDGAADVDLDGWTIRDETTSNRFVIEARRLGAGRSIRFRTGRGDDGPEDHHLGQDAPVWSNRGETALLLDPDGRVAAYAFSRP